MSGHGEKMGRKQEQAIAALLQQPTIMAAADSLGIGEATLWRWLQQPAFEEAYRRARQAVVDQAISQLQQATGQAVATLQEVQRDPDAPASSRVTAAKAVLEIAFKLRASEELERRLATLEEKLQHMTAPTKGGQSNEY